MRRAVIANESGRRGKCLGNKKPNYFYRILVVRFVFQLLIQQISIEHWCTYNSTLKYLSSGRRFVAMLYILERMFI